MKVIVIYRPNSEHGSAVEAFIRDFRSRHNTDKLEALDIDSREGTAIASLYDVMQYPAILALREDGSLVKDWQGQPLPLMNELAYYVLDVT